MDPLKQFGRSVRARRKFLGHSSEDVALAAEIDVSYLGRIERGEVNASLLIIVRIAQTLGVPVGELLSDIL